MRTALVVDDDPEWREYLCRTVGCQYPVMSVGKGEAVARIASHTNPSVIILDVITVDGKDGLTTFCELRKGRETRNIPVIMISEVNHVTGLKFGSKEMREYLGSAPFAFLEKPVAPEQLMRVITAVIGAKLR